jgi:DNA-binding winged helix-turn-helix (wHTH) protein
VRVVLDGVTLDTDSRQLFRDADEVRVSPKAFDLLALLVESRPRAVSKKELLERIWPATYVSEASLATLIREIRDALCDDARIPRYVRTVHRFGYAFCGAAADAPAIAPRQRLTGLGSWLLWQGHQILLRPGDNVLGREPDASAWLDAATVSRHHARIVISGDEATLEDLGSKNGTFLRGAPVTRASRLVDGDEIQVGSELVTFRMPRAAGSTATRP